MSKLKTGTTIGGSTAWHAGNDGTGSGLDADTVDGIEGANFLRSDTADTASGVITFSSGLTVNNNISFSGISQNSYTGILQETDQNLTLGTTSGSESRIYLKGSANGQGDAGTIFIGAPNGITLNNDTIITGNLTVNGTTTTVNSNTVNIGDNIIVLNSDETGSPSQNAGIEIERGTGTNTLLRYNETNDRWEFTNDGSTYHNIATGVEDGATADQTLADINALEITQVGTITSGTWEATDVAVSHGGTGASDAATARTNLGLAIGTDVQAYNATLAAVAGGTYTGDNSITTVGTIATGTWQATAIADAYISSAATWDAKQDALTFGIADTNTVVINSASVADNDYAKFTASGLEGRSASEVKTDLSLNNVENTALSTWAGSTNITTVGTIATGTWQATAIADAYISSATDWNTAYSYSQVGHLPLSGGTVSGDVTVGGDLIITTTKQPGTYSDNWKTTKYVRTGATTVGSGNTGNTWVHLFTISNSTTYNKVHFIAKIGAFDDVAKGTEIIEGFYENSNTSQENHTIYWRRGGAGATYLFNEIRSIRSSSSGLSNTYDVYAQITAAWIDYFTVDFEYWVQNTSGSTVSFPSTDFSASAPSAGSDDKSLTVRTDHFDNIITDSITSTGTIYSKGATTSDATEPGAIILASGGTQASPSTAGRGLEFLTSTANNGYGHRLVSFDNTGGDIPLLLQRRNNASAWTTQITFQGNSNAVDLNGDFSCDAISAAGNLQVEATATTNLAALRLHNAHGDAANQGSVDIDFDVTASTSQVARARIRGSESTADAPYSELSFWTSNSTSTEPTQRMVIDKDGNVGLGTTSSPDSRLTVTDSANTDTVSTGRAGIRIERPDAAGQYGWMEYLYGSDTLFIGSRYTGGTATAYGQIWFAQDSNGGDRRYPIKIDASSHVSFRNEVRLQDPDGTTRLWFEAQNSAPHARIHTTGGEAIGFYDGGVENVRIAGNGQVTIWSISDAQLLLNGNGTTWAGIGFTDADSGPSYIYWRGLTDTWAFGGSGATATGKRIHCDGSMTIGNTYDNTAAATNGLSVLGTINCASDVVAYASDKRLKENIQKIEKPLEKLQKITGVTFDWKDMVSDIGFNPEIMKNEIGVIAQEVQEVIPQAIYPAPFDFGGVDMPSKTGEHYLTVQHDKIIPLLIESIKEQQQIIDKLSKRIEVLEGVK